MHRDIRQTVDLIYELVKRDLKVRYHRSAFGFGWTIIKPLSQLVVFSLIFDGVLKLGIPNYVSFVFVGVLAWSWFSTSVQAATTSVIESASLIRRPGFPAQVVPLVIVLTNGLHFFLALPLLMAVVIWQIGPVSGWIFALPLIMFCQAVLILAIAYATACLNVYYRDIEHIVAVFLMLGFYITPVFYRTLPAHTKFAFIHEYNPMAWILRLYRTVLIDQEPPDGALLMKALIVSIILLIASRAMFRRISPDFGDYL